MKLNDSIISSVDSLRANFDFVEIWNKRDIAVRDLSPDRILYTDDLSKFLYGAFAHPENIAPVNGTLDVPVNITDDKGNKKVEVKHIEFDIRHPALARFPQSERIQIVALFLLGGGKFDTSAIRDITATEVSFADDKVTLINGQSLKCSKQPASQPLSHKVIIVASSSRKPSRVGDYTLQPGQATYGVFSGTVLIDVAPPYTANNSFKFEYTLLDKDDFIVIDGLSVTCFKNEDLNNRLRREVIKAKCPQIVTYDRESALVTVTYEDGSTIELIK